ncbi:Uncharacterised protein [Bordetella pertussis]|nr:Uncharacterised protein [Bordetella pertussis]
MRDMNQVRLPPGRGSSVGGSSRSRLIESSLRVSAAVSSVGSG